MELLCIIVFCLVVGFLIRILGRSIMNIGISLIVIIVVLALLSSMSIFDFF